MISTPPGAISFRLCLALALKIINVIFDALTCQTLKGRIMEKDFDAVKYMRSIRERLRKEYEKKPELREK
ncbi:MAG: hypothetical protein H0U27_12725 [Nitrosopumilus sp.]|nr:hypothetical protein [Nitrosopumilus sp.]